MNVRTVELTSEKAHDRLGNMRWEHQLKWQHQVDEFKQLANQLMNDLQLSLQRVEEAGVTMNELGVLQGRGPALDRLCGMLKQSAETDRKLAKLAEEQSR